MVSGIIIKLEAPICQCAEEDLVWAIEVTKTEESEAFLVVSCNMCRAEYSVPANNLLGNFELAVGYPGPPAKPRRQPGVVWGEVLPFSSDSET